MADDWVAKELSCVAVPGAGTGHVSPECSQRDSCFDLGEAHVRWLSRVSELAREWSRGSFGIFGTSIAGTWLFEEVGGRAGFFVDEDPQRIGRSHLDRPVIGPQSVAAGASVLIGMPPPLASGIRERLRASFPHVNYVVPPPSPFSGN
jgi:hypothetical protein